VNSSVKHYISYVSVITSHQCVKRKR